MKCDEQIPLAPQFLHSCEGHLHICHVLLGFNRIQKKVEPSSGIQPSSIYKIKMKLSMMSINFPHAKLLHLHASESSSSQIFIEYFLFFLKTSINKKHLPLAHGLGAVTFLSSGFKCLYKALECVLIVEIHHRI